MRVRHKCAPKEKSMRRIIEHLNPYCGFFYDISSIIVERQSRYQKIELAESPEFGKVIAPGWHYPGCNQR